MSKNKKPEATVDEEFDQSSAETPDNASETVTLVTMVPPRVRREMAEGIPVAHVVFTVAQDFPGLQESNVRCGEVPAERGRSYCASYLPEMHSFAIRAYNNGATIGEIMVPREQVRRWVRA